MRIARSVPKFAASLRMLPAIAWLAVQLSMAGLPLPAASAAHPYDADIVSLFEVLGEDRIVLCTPEGAQVLEPFQEHAAHAECEWCQGFSATIRTEGPKDARPVRQTPVPAWSEAPGHRAAWLQARRCHPCRAPRR